MLYLVALVGLAMQGVTLAITAPEDAPTLAANLQDAVGPVDIMKRVVAVALAPALGRPLCFGPVLVEVGQVQRLPGRSAVDFAIVATGLVLGKDRINP